MKSITLITTALLLGGSILSVAKAAPPSEIPTAVVKFGDLDATRPAGMEELYRRLRQAARGVCRSLDPADSAAKELVTSLYKACIEQAVWGAVVKINRPDFTDYAATRTRKPAGADTRLAAR
jgi:UrcA family protein